MTRLRNNKRFRIALLCAAIILILCAIFLFIILTPKEGEWRFAKDDATAHAKREEPLPDTITLAYYNVENLFDFNLDGTEYDEYKPNFFGWTQAVAQTKLNNVAQVIAAINADVIGLSEIENLNVLLELQNALDRMGYTYPYARVAETPNSAIVNALLSKFPVWETTAHPVERARSILEARIARGGDEFIVFVNHWASKRNPESRRLASALVLKERIDQLPQGTDYIILGDFNANHNEWSTFHTENFNDTEGRTGINHVLKTIIYDDTKPQHPKKFVCKNELLESCTDCHYNLWLELDETDRWSYIFRGAKQTIDQILVPSSMFDTSGYSYLDNSFETFTWDGKLLRDGVPFRWQMRFRGSERYHVGTGFSDHLPLVAKIVRANLHERDTTNAHCPVIDPALRKGDFAVTVDGWVSGDSRFTAMRDNRFARTGTHSLRVFGMHETENRTAARVRLRPHGSPQFLTMSIRGSGNLSIRIRRGGRDAGGQWVNFNAPDFAQARSIRYRPWQSNNWTNLRLRLPPPPSPNETDVLVELRAGKGARLNVWVDRVRLE